MISSAAAIFYSPLMFWSYHGLCEFQSNLWKRFKGLQLQIILQKLSPSSFYRNKFLNSHKTPKFCAKIENCGLHKKRFIAKTGSSFEDREKREWESICFPTKTPYSIFQVSEVIWFDLETRNCGLPEKKFSPKPEVVFKIEQKG